MPTKKNASSSITNGLLTKTILAVTVSSVVYLCICFHVYGPGNDLYAITSDESFLSVLPDPVSTVANHPTVWVKNPIEIENELTGSPDWVLSNPALNHEIEGYCSRTSIKKGEKLMLFHNTASAAVRIEVFRTGWYSGVGARKLGDSVEVAGVVQKIPKPDKDGRVVCAWKDPYIIESKDSWTTGVYLVKMTEMTGLAQSYALFVLRDDDRTADITFQLPVNTYQAYNYWGGTSLYRKAVKVSFDRPYAAPENKEAAFGSGAGEYLVNIQPIATYPISSSASWNYNMVRWMEKNNLDVSYITNTDVHTLLPNLPKPKVFLTQGHDEYWSWAMRDHVTSWRDEGVDLIFFGSNTAYWQIRYEDIDHNDTDTDEPRTIVCYRRKQKDPDKSQYRSVKFRQVRPEALLVGVEYFFPLGDPYDEDMIVANSSHWVFSGTGVSNGKKLPGLLGYEVDRIREEALVPLEGNTEEQIYVEKIFETPLIDRKNRQIISHGAMYKAKSGANVFASGTMQWSWGLDDYGVVEGLRSSRLNTVIEKMTWNLLQAAKIERGVKDVMVAPV